MRSSAVDRAFELFKDEEIASITDELVELQEKNEWILADQINITSEFSTLSSLRKRTNTILKAWLEKSKVTDKNELLFESISIPASEQDSLYVNLRKYDSISTSILNNQVIPANKIHKQNHKIFLKIFEKYKLNNDKIDATLQNQMDSLLNSEPIFQRRPFQTPFSTYFMYSLAIWFEKTSDIPVEELKKSLADRTRIFPSRGEVSIGSSICKLGSLTRAQLELVCQRILSYECAIDSLLLEAERIL